MLLLLHGIILDDSELFVGVIHDSLEVENVVFISVGRDRTRCEPTESRNRGLLLSILIEDVTSSIERDVLLSALLCDGLVLNLSLVNIDVVIVVVVTCGCW